jgi:hypothetical protein
MVNKMEDIAARLRGSGKEGWFIAIDNRRARLYKQFVDTSTSNLSFSLIIVDSFLGSRLDR